MKIIFFLILLSARSAMAQITVLSIDLNNDKLIDTVTKETENNPSYSFTRLLIKFGGDKKSVKIEDNYFFSSFYSMVSIPKQLIAPKISLSKIGLAVFDNAQANTPDPSLQWLLSLRKLNSATEGGVEYKMAYKPVWIDGNPELPSPYFVVMHKKYLNDVLFKSLDKSSFSNTIFLHYLSNNHGKIKLLPEALGSISLYQTNHGVLIKHGPRYSWCFISEGDITSMNKKLRWPTIKQVLLYKKAVIILQENVDADHLYIVNYLSGKFIKLKDGIYGNRRIKRISIKPDSDFLELTQDSGVKEIQVNTYCAMLK